MPVRIEKQAEPIPGYRLIERLGRGGYGEVWKAEAPGGVLKAIKFVYGNLLEQEPSGDVAPAEQELKALGRVKTVRHPYLLALDRYDIVDGQLMIVMELADRSLWDRFNECRQQGERGIPRDELVRYMEETAEALDLMNIQHQLQHLDIKPQNLFLMFNHVKVADFGVVKMLEGMVASVTGGITPAYAAPETFEGTVSRFSDQYSMAIVYQELLTGQRPFTGTNPRQLLAQHLLKPPDVTPLPIGDRDVIARALGKSPDARFPTCTDLVRALRDQQRPAVPVVDVAATPVMQVRADRMEAPAADPALGGTPRRDTPGAAPGAPVTQMMLPPPATPAASTATFPQATPGDSRGAQAASRPGSADAALAADARGDGVLFPALLIGVGRRGLDVLRRLRSAFRDRLGNAEALPQVRMLYLDTDGDEAAGARHGVDGGLCAADVFWTRLHRPSHYIKSSDERELLETWLDTQLLYVMPRVPATVGVRALGRLAFCDNRTTVATRVRTALEACTRPDVLDMAARETRLGWFSRVPRVYLIAGLAGGTGSGMLVDLAYGVRAQLRLLGYESTRVTGVFLVPGTDAPALALGNAFAALTELNHYATPGVSFSTKYGPKEAPTQHQIPPVDRCVLLPFSKPAGEGEAPEDAGLAAGWLYREVATAPGRHLEGGPDGAPAEAQPQPRMSWQTPAAYRLGWPRRTFLRTAAQRLCRRLIAGWVEKDTLTFAETLKGWVDEQWAQRELSAEHILDGLQASCQQALGAAPEEVFAAVVDVLTPPGAPRTLEPAAVKDVLAQLEKLVGRSDDNAERARGRSIPTALGAAVPARSAEAEHRLARLVVDLIDQPQFRIAAAEQAVQRVAVTIEQTLQGQDGLCQDLLARANAAHTAVWSLLEKNSPRITQKSAVSNVLESLRSYARLRYQGLVLEHARQVYRAMVAHLPDLRHEIGLCRVRLKEYLTQLQSPKTAGPLEVRLEPGRDLLPVGAANVAEAADRWLTHLQPEEMAALDQRVQQLVERQFRALVQICTHSDGLRAGFQAAMVAEAEAFVAQRLDGINAVTLFLGDRPDEAVLEDLRQIADRLVSGAVAGAVGPEVDRPLAVLPAVPEADSLCALLAEAVPGIDVVTSDNADEIVFYRQHPAADPSHLPQAGAKAVEAYRYLSGREHFTPHSRLDVPEWRPLGEAKPADEPAVCSGAAAL
jgi:hypothetical protein